MPYRLVLAEGTQSYDIREGATLVVGRAPTSDVPIFDATVSRRHAEVRSDGGHVEVRDLGSSNGTYVNGVRVEAQQLVPEDTVTFGKITFRFLATVPPRRRGRRRRAGSARPSSGSSRDGSRGRASGCSPLPPGA